MTPDGELRALHDEFGLVPAGFDHEDRSVLVVLYAPTEEHAPVALIRPGLPDAQLGSAVARIRAHLERHRDGDAEVFWDYDPAANRAMAVLHEHSMSSAAG